MAPKVTVPCDFGREYIGSPDHSNLKLKLKDNNELLVNSMIVSYNSPVIHDLTTNLHQTSLDVDDFEDAAVRCFVDCLYTGEIELVNKHILRDVYKMASVFNVAWLVSRCNGYFQDLTDIVDCEDYEEVLLLFEEARYAADTLKQSDWLDLIIAKIHGTEGGKKQFIEKYLEDFNNLTIAQLDIVLKLSAGSNYVVGVLAIYLANAENQGLTDNFKSLLINCNLGVCRKTDRKLYEDLFDLLDTIADDLSTANIKMIYKLHRQSSKKIIEKIVHVAEYPNINTKLSNIFNSFKQFESCKTLDELINQLSISPEVKSLYMFFDALHNTCSDGTVNQNSVLQITKRILEKIVKTKQRRGWDTIAEIYLNSEWFKNRAEWFQNRKMMEKIVTPSINKDSYFTLPQEYILTADEFFLKMCKIPLFFDDDKNGNIAKCKQPGKCGFMLISTPGTRENMKSFDIRLCVDEAEYPPDIHYHREFKAEDMHLSLDNCMEQRVGYPDRAVGVQITWNMKPRWETDRWWWGDHFIRSGNKLNVFVFYNGTIREMV